MEWLLARAVVRNDAREAAKWAVEGFRVRPTVEAWKRVRAHADARTARALLRDLERREQHRLLIDLHLADDDPDAARLAWKKLRGARLWGGGALADAMARKHPEDAVSLWLAEVDDLVRRGERSSYRTAGGILRRGRDLLRKARHGPIAIRLLAEAREKHRHRSAFLDELAQCLR